MFTNQSLLGNLLFYFRNEYLFDDLNIRTGFVRKLYYSNTLCFTPNERRDTVPNNLVNK